MASYRVVETKPLPGYVKSDTKIQVTLDGAFINPDQPLATIVNQRIHIHGIKVDTSGQYLAGVEFSLINADTGANVETVTSNEKGEFILTRFDYGNWIIREIKAPEGFIPMQDISLHVDESWTEPAVFTCVNIPDHYAFLKTDSDGHPLAGVKFALEDAKGNVLRELVSGEDGVVRVTDLERGDYVIREIEALEGFQKSEETLRFTIDESYVVPDEMPRFINYKEGGVIQTGFEMTMTPMMWAGAADGAGGRTAGGAVYHAREKAQASPSITRYAQHHILYETLTGGYDIHVPILSPGDPALATGQNRSTGGKRYVHPTAAVQAARFASRRGDLAAAMDGHFAG